MTHHKPTGWNTWDYRGFNRLSLLARGKLVVALHYAIWDQTAPPPAPDSRQIGRLHETFRWEDVTRLGPHAPLGLPAELDFNVVQTPFRASAWCVDGTLHLHVEPRADTHLRVVFLLDAPLGEHLEIASEHEGRFARCRITLEHARWPADYFIKTAQPYAIAPAGWGAKITVAPAARKQDMAADFDAPGTFERLRECALTGRGALDQAPQAMTEAVMWNTLFDSRRRLVSSPVSRDWCSDWDGVLVFCWDTYLVGAFTSYASNRLARLNFEAVSRAVDEIGHVPNYFMAHGAASLDRSMPPIGSYMVLKTQRANPDLKWLGGVYKQLRRWHGYWRTHRDGNGNGLFSWGSNAEPQYTFKEIEPYNGPPQHTKQAAQYESGLDNSPLFDEAEFNPQTGTLELDDVALSSYYALDCECLATIADLLGRARDARAFRDEHAAVAERINALLWDDEHGIYCNRHWDGRLSNRWAPTSFFPLIAGVAPQARAERMVREHLLNEREFWGKYVLPSISRSDPAYHDNDYWRGRIWGPFNFLTCEGLRRYRMDEIASELSMRSLDIFMDNWRRDGGVYENYNSETGAGGDVWNAARLYHWGGLLAFLGMQELIDVEPTGGFLRVGSLKFPAGGLSNVRISGDRYDVDLGDGVQARRNGRAWLDCNARAVVRVPLSDNPAEPIQLVTSRPGRLLLDGESVARPITVNSGGPRPPERVNGQIRYEW